MSDVWYAVITGTESYVFERVVRRSMITGWSLEGHE
jgi:hypothetical protein